MWVTYTFLLTYIIILGAHTAHSDTEPEPQCPWTLTLSCFSVLLEPVLVPVPVPVPALAPVPHSPTVQTGASAPAALFLPPVRGG